MSDDCGQIFKGWRILWHAFVGADSRSSGSSMYGCGASRPTDRPTDGSARLGQSATGSDEASVAARLILNIDHVYSTQRDSLVITISTTGQHGPLASSIVPVRPGPVRHGPSPSHPAPSVRLAWPVGHCEGTLVGSHCIAATLAGSFVISSNGFRSFVRR